MLVLTRNNGQEIQIGDNIKIKVLHIVDRKVRLGIDAPKEMNIVRTELLNRDEVGRGPHPSPESISRELSSHDIPQS